MFHYPLSGPDLTYISLLIIFCIIEYVTNPWDKGWAALIYVIHVQNVEVQISKDKELNNK